MVVIGADVHKRSHTFVAVDEAGRKRAEITVATTSEGNLKALKWAVGRFGADLLWGIEDCRNMSARLERDLLGAGQKVVRVPPKLMARTRASARTHGKSDPIDALAVARTVLREPDLPIACHDEVSRECKLLTDRRETLVAQRTAAINRLRWNIHELDTAADPGDLSTNKHQQLLAAWLADKPGLVAEIAAAELADIIRLCAQITTITARISQRIQATAPALLAIPGCGELTAAKIIGETAGVNRFRSEAAFACHAGVAPIPAWSGHSAGKVRLSRAGNRQLNTALHRIALTQIRLEGPGKTYHQRLRQTGKTGPEARRCLKRRIARRVFHALHTDHQTRQTTPLSNAA
jgi:transposase